MHLQAGASSAGERGRGREGRASGPTLRQHEGDRARGTGRGEGCRVEKRGRCGHPRGAMRGLLSHPSSWEPLGAVRIPGPPLRLSQRLPRRRLLLGPADAGPVGAGARDAALHGTCRSPHDTLAWSRQVRKRALQSGTASIPGRHTGGSGNAARVPSTSPFTRPASGTLRRPHLEQSWWQPGNLPGPQGRSRGRPLLPAHVGSGVQDGQRPPRTLHGELFLPKRGDFREPDLRRMGLIRVSR